MILNSQHFNITCSNVFSLLLICVVLSPFSCLYAHAMSRSNIITMIYSLLMKVVMYEQSMDHISLQKERTGCYTK